uniref:Retrotransposon Copia-like N-terminal domain-containing protein n=1 Tax=Manihot esculenta TaxID=3983 RepID=A0A2C9VZ57_MANES
MILHSPIILPVTLPSKAKDKLGFINDGIRMPAVGTPKYVKWTKADSMVSSWNLNSISKEIVEVFLYTNSKKALWEEIKKRFGECNDPLT